MFLLIRDQMEIIKKDLIKRVWLSHKTLFIDIGKEEPLKFYYEDKSELKKSVSEIFHLLLDEQ